MKRLAVLLACLWLPLWAGAQDEAQHWYQVEVIVFTQDQIGALSQEDWSQDPGLPDMQQAVDLTPAPQAGAAPVPFETVPPDQLQLNDVYAKLEHSGRYKPVLHLAWRQPALDGDKAVAVRIAAPLPDDAQGASAPGAVAPAASGAPGPVAGDAGAAVPTEGISGTLRLRVSRYLHLDVDIAYRRQVPAPPGDANAAAAPAGDDSSANSGAGGETPSVYSAPTGPTIQTYRLTQDRRVKRDELNYFDHPMFGVLAEVTAYEPPPPAQATPAPAAAAPAGAALPLPVPNPGKATAAPLH